nr:uncharacterized protein LOC126542442 [Dermacentor andersoni]
MPKAPKARKKLLLAAPVSMRWPTVDDECRTRLLERFRNMTGTWDLKTQSHLVLGLNATARALEQTHLSALLLNSSADPPRLLHGLIRLARNKNTPVLCVSELQEWVPGLNSLLALGMRQTAPPSKSVDDFLNAVRLNGGTCSEKASGNGSTVESKDGNEIVGETAVTSAASESTNAEPAISAKRTSESKSSEPFSEEDAETACTKTEHSSEAQAEILHSEICATKDRLAASVAVDIELSEDGGLGFPDYEWECGSLVEVVESSSHAPQKIKPVAVHSAHQASCLAKANIKQVFSKGKLKAKKKRGVPKAIQ